MRFLIILILLFLSLAFQNNATKVFPQDYFTPPVKGKLRLSGTFGELRPNHFHAGIDIKGYVGQSLYATADGYIKRIKVQKGGYGKVLYLQHPNGYTSVYAHMDKFSSNIEAYVKTLQYEYQKFEVDIRPGQQKFTFRQGDKLGTMGMTGRSFGPHLHFEIRDSKSDLAINPLLFNFQVKDDQSPRIHELRLYYLDESYKVLDSKNSPG